MGMGWPGKMYTISCSAFLVIPLMLLLLSLTPTAAATEAAAPDAAAGTVSVRPTAAATETAAGTVKVEDSSRKLEEEGRRWWFHGFGSECAPEDRETEEMLGMDSFTNQQLLAAASYVGGYITNPVLRPDIPVCQKRGNCRPTAVAPKPPTRCTGWCRRDYSPSDAAAY